MTVDEVIGKDHDKFYIITGDELCWIIRSLNQDHFMNGELIDILCRRLLNDESGKRTFSK